MLAEYITNANTDDRHRKDALEIMANILDQNPNIGLVYADVIITSTENETFENHTPVGAYRWLDYCREFLTLGCFIGPQPMWRKSLHNIYGYFDESFTSSGDWEFWLRIADRTEMLHIPEFLGLYFYSPQSAEHRDHKTRIQEDMRIQQKYVSKYLSSLDDIEHGLQKVDELSKRIGDYRPYERIKTILINLKRRILAESSIKTTPFEKDLLQTFTSDNLGEKKIISLNEEKIGSPFQLKKGLSSIIVLIFDQTDHLSKCLQSIKYRTSEPHEVIIVQVGSVMDSESLRDLREKHKFTLIEDKNPLPYPQAINKGIAEAKGEYVVILSDDVVVTEGWLSGMLEHLNSADDIGIVAPMTVNVDGPQGVHKFEIGDWRSDSDDRIIDEINKFAKAFRERNRHRRIETVNLNGFCMLFKRDLPKKIGFMDERLEIPDFADNDYCLRAATEGYRNIIAGDIFVYSRLDRTLAGKSGKISPSLPKISKLFFDKWNNLPPASPLGKKMMILSSISASNELKQKGKYADAIQILFPMKEPPPENNKFYFTLAELLIEQNRLNEAINILENMPESLKDNADRLAFIGHCKALMNQLEDAEKFADDALELNKKSSKALNLKGLIALKKENFSEAEKFFYQAIDADKGYNEPYLNLGRLKWEKGKREEALTLYEKAFILNPMHNETIDKYVDTIGFLKKFEQAEKIIEEAVDVYPSNKKLRFALADVFLKQKKRHEAMNVLQDTLRNCGVDNETLSFALEVRENIGPKEIKREQAKVKKVEGSLKTKKKTNKKTRKTQLTQKTQQTISLCMIVKNEESNLVNCLSKVGSLVDEIIVADTGSTDRTKDIAKIFGAKVFDFKWNNNFSDARNFSLSKASGDWILILDADEVISPKDHDRITELIKKGGEKPAIAYSFITRNYKHNVSLEWTANDGQYLEEEAGTGWVPSKKVRLFPNDSRIRFENPVHELVEYSLMRLGIKIEKCDIPVHHYGKLFTEKQISKNIAYYEMGKTKLDNKKEQDLSALFEIAVQTSELGKHEEALKYWKQLVQLNPDYTKAYIGLGITYFELGMYENAVSAMKTAFAIEPDSRDIMTLLSKFEFCVGNCEAVIPILEKLIEIEPSYPTALGLLSAAYFCSDRKKEGFAYAKKLNETNFDASRFFVSFASTLIKANQLIYANKLLEAMTEGNLITPETYTLFDECRKKMGKLRDKGKDIIVEEVEGLPLRSEQTLKSQIQQTISLCMIVKNEEENIGHCLSSVKGLVDEIIVVDTGSTDRTKDIANEFGAKVFDFKWNNNFSDARNFSLSKAAGDWIFILDADEVISPSDHEKIKNLIRESLDKSVAYSFITRNYIMELNNIDWTPNDGNYSEEAGTGWFPGEKVRLFPNKPGIKFDYPIHERIEPSLVKIGVKIESTNIPIHHYGTLDREKENRKSQIYYEMAKKKVLDDKSTDYTAFHELAVHASNLGKFEEALEYLQKAIELNPNFGRAYFSQGNNYFNLHRFEDALLSYEKAIEIDPVQKDAMIQAALCEIYLEKPILAINRLEKFLKEKPEHLKALALLLIAYLGSGNKIRAETIIEKLTILKFNYAHFITYVARTLLSFRQIDFAISLLESAIDMGINGRANILLSTSNMIKKLNENKSKVSIVLLASDRSDNLNKYIENIKRNTFEPHEFIVSSVQKEKTHVSSKKDVIATGESTIQSYCATLNYAKAVNKGLKESSGDYIVLIKDDVIVTEGWLTGLIECANSSSDIGLVGPMMTNVEGSQGIKIANSSSSATTKKEITRDDLESIGLDEFASSFRQKNRYRWIEQKKLSGECILIKHSLIEKVGIFDEQFQTPEYALDDYCLRASLNNYRSLIAGDVFVHKIDSLDKQDLVKFREYTIAHNKTLFTDRKHFIDKWSASDVDEETRKKLITLNSLRYADELSQQGQKNNAIQAILEGLKYSPDDDKLHFALVSYMVENGKYIEAFDILEKMPENLKKDVRWFVFAGLCKDGIHLLDKAEKYANEAISLNNKSAKAWNLKGLISYNRGLFDEAERYFIKAIELDKGYGEAYANLGAIKWKKDYKEEALNLFERGFILSPTVENVVINYHAVAVSLSQQERAEKIFKEAVDLYPHDRRLKYVLVDLLLQQEKYGEAMDVFEDAMVAFGIEKDTLSIALGIRDKIGPKEITTLPSGARNDTARATISLCMIVKNEEKNIGRCLHNIKPLVDEMIVVDTGSTDRTKDIAKAFGAKVYDFAWTGDFSEARNYSLSKASGEWILILDADEVIAPFDQDVLKELLSLPAYKASGFTITTRNYVVPVSTIGWRANDGSYIKQEAGSGWFPSDKVRIFPNHPHIRFEFPVHEFVEMAMQKVGIRNIIIDIPVHHYGKLDRDKIITKGEDYYILGKLKLSQRGEKDFIALYELAVQASELERFDEALKYWKKLTEVKPDFPKAFFGLANSYYHMAKFQEALDSLDQALKLEKDPDERREMIPLYAACSLCIGKAEGCIPLLEETISKYPEFPMIMLMLSMVYCCTNKKDDGKKYLSLLRKKRMNFDNYLYEFAEFLIKTGNLNYALSIIEAALETGTQDERFSILLEQCQRLITKEN